VKLTSFPGLTLNLAWSAGVGDVQLTPVEALSAAGTTSRSAKAAAARVAEKALVKVVTGRFTNTFPLPE
jgi:hypothetical protein